MKTTRSRILILMLTKHGEGPLTPDAATTMREYADAIEEQYNKEPIYDGKPIPVGNNPDSFTGSSGCNIKVMVGAGTLVQSQDDEARVFL
jgi:hypothetical protein